VEPGDGPGDEQAPPRPDTCPNCGTPHGADQEYCLECGARLPAFRKARVPGSLIAAGIAIVLLAVAGVVAGILLASGDDSTPSANATTTLPLETTLAGPITQTFVPSTDVPPATGGVDTGLPADTGLPPVETTLVPQGTDPSLTPTTPTVPPPNDTTTQPGVTTPTTPPAGDSDWPAGQSGYTVIVASIPVSQGEAAAQAQADRATAAGLPQAGVLESSQFSSLRPGFYAVFSGVYSSLDQAKSALPQARSAGFTDAYTRRVTP
jgi:hypothetical protein